MATLDIPSAGGTPGSGLQRTQFSALVRAAIAEAEDEILRLEELTFSSSVHKRKCAEVLRTARLSLACLLQAEQRNCADPVQVLLGARHLTAAARRAALVLAPCAAARTSAWKRGLVALRRRPLRRTLSSAQHELEGAVDPELQHLLLLGGLDAGADDVDGAAAEDGGVQGRSLGAAAGPGAAGGGAVGEERQLGGRALPGAPRVPCSVTEGGGGRGDPYRCLLRLGSALHGPGPLLGSTAGLFNVGCIRPSDGKASVERVWFMPTEPTAASRTVGERLPPPPGAVGRRASASEGGLAGSSGGRMGGSPTMLMAVLGSPLIQVNRSGGAGGALPVPTVSVSVLGSAGGGALLTYCSALGGFHSRLPFTTSAEHVSAAAVDRASCVLYTGHGDGSITACAYGQSHQHAGGAPQGAQDAVALGLPGGQPASFACTNAIITVMCVEAPGRLWVGDNTGRVIAYTLSPFSARMLRPFEEPSTGPAGAPASGGAGGSWPGAAIGRGVAEAGARALAPALDLAADLNARLVSAVTPAPKVLTAITSHQGLVFAANDKGSLCLITSADRTVQALATNPAYGCITALAVVPWLGEASRVRGASADAGPAGRADAEGVTPTPSAPSAGAGGAGAGVHAGRTGSTTAGNDPGAPAASGPGRPAADAEPSPPSTTDGGAGAHGSALERRQGEGAAERDEPSTRGKHAAKDAALPTVHEDEEHSRGHGRQSTSVVDKTAAYLRRRLPWRLLAGTSQGSVLLWDATHQQLQLKCVVASCGPSLPKLSAARLIRGVFVYPDLGMLVAGVADGTLLVASLPIKGDLPAALQEAEDGGASAAPAAHDAAGPPAQAQPPPRGAWSGGSRQQAAGAVDGSTAGLDIDEAKVPALSLQTAHVRAHKSRLQTVDACGMRLATGSVAGGVKVWDILDLRRAALRQGVALPSLPLHLAAIDDAAVIAASPTLGRRFASAVHGPRACAAAATARTSTSQPTGVEPSFVAAAAASAAAQGVAPAGTASADDPAYSHTVAGTGAAADVADVAISLRPLSTGGVVGTAGDKAVGAGAGAHEAGGDIQALAAELASRGPVHQNGDAAAAATAAAPLQDASHAKADGEGIGDSSSPTGTAGTDRPQAAASPSADTCTPATAGVLMNGSGYNADAARPSDMYGVAAASEAAASPFAFIASAVLGGDEPPSQTPAAAPQAAQVSVLPLPVQGAAATAKEPLLAPHSPAANPPMLMDDSPFCQATRAAAAAAGVPSSPASAGSGTASGSRAGTSAGGAAAGDAEDTRGSAGPFGRPADGSVAGSSRRGGGQRVTIAQPVQPAGPTANGTAAGGWRESRTAAGGGGSNGSGGAPYASPTSSRFPSPSSSQLQLATAASNPSGPVLPAHSGYMGGVPSGAYAAAARAIAAAGGGAGAASSGGGSPYASPRATHQTQPPAPSPPGVYLDRTSTGLGPAAGATPDPFGAGSVYGSSIDHMQLSIISGPGGTLARNPTSTFIRRADLHFVQEIGCGAEGRVWRARWQHTDVAVKEMLPRASTFAKLTGALKNQARTSAAGGGAGTSGGGGGGQPSRPLQPGLSRAPTLPAGGAHGSEPGAMQSRQQSGSGTDTSSHAGTPAKPTAAAAAPASGAAAGAGAELAAVPAGAQLHPAATAASAAGEDRSLTSTHSAVPSGGSTLGSTAAAAAAAAEADGVDVAAVLKEVRALAQLSQHPNIVRFIGLCVEQPLIVTEYYPRGSLFDMLRKAAIGDRESYIALDWHHRLSMMHDVAAGMSYLHSQNYLHGDLRSPNIFVVQQGRVKIGDFGYSKLLGDGGRGSASTSTSANPRWVAPEALQVGRVTRSADVFSFAVVMWEVLTWQIPYDEYNAFQIIVRKAREPDFRPSLPPLDQLPGLPPHADVEGYCELMRACWQYDPTTRPTFDEIAERLDVLKTASVQAQRALRRSEVAGPSARQSLSPIRPALSRHGSAASMLGQGGSPGGAVLGGGSAAAAAGPAVLHGHRRTASNTAVQYTLPGERNVSGGGGLFGGRSTPRGPSLLGPGGLSNGPGGGPGLQPLQEDADVSDPHMPRPSDGEALASGGGARGPWLPQTHAVAHVQHVQPWLSPVRTDGQRQVQEPQATADSHGEPSRSSPHAATAAAARRDALPAGVNAQPKRDDSPSMAVDSSSPFANAAAALQAASGGTRTDAGPPSPFADLSLVLGLQ